MHVFRVGQIYTFAEYEKENMLKLAAEATELGFAVEFGVSPLGNPCFRVVNRTDYREYKEQKTKWKWRRGK